MTLVQGWKHTYETWTPLHTYRSKPSHHSISPCIINYNSRGYWCVSGRTQHQGARITNLGDAFWWAIVTITIVGYGEYFPLTLAGRLIAIAVMFSGIGIVVVIVGIISQRRIQSLESRLKSRTETRPRLFGDENKTAIIDKIDGIDKLTEDEFDTLITRVKNLRRTLLEESKILYKCSRCSNVYYSKPKFCSNCGLKLT